jgi:hypothetical protein
MIIVAGTLAVAGLLLFAIYRLHMARSAKSPKSPKARPPSPTTSVQSYEIKVQHSVEASMEEGHSAEKDPVEQVDDKSTACPSISDKQSEPSLCGEVVENASTPEQGTSVVNVKAMTPVKRSRSSRATQDVM